MEVLPFAYMGERNFPDIEIEKIEISSNQVLIVGEMEIFDVFDKLFIEGFSELVFSSTQPIRCYQEKKGNWEVISSPDVNSVYLMSFNEENGEIMLNAVDSNKHEIKIVLAQAKLTHRYL